MYRLVDTHAHLDQIENLNVAIEKAKDSGLVAIVAVGVDYESNERVLEIAEEYRSFVFPALGCHPGDLGETASEIDRNLQFIEDNIGEAIAVGEIGLDYHKKIIGRASKETQKQALRDVLKIAKQFEKPVLVHSRYSWRDSFTLVQESQVEKAVFHWYTGPINVLHDFVGKGYFASATLAAEYHQEHRRAIKEMPLDKLLLETDCPVVYRWGTEHAHPSEPADVPMVSEEVATLKGVDPGMIAQKTTENAIMFFGIPT